MNEGQDVQVTINGAPASGFNYNTSNRELTANLNLADGPTVIVVTAVNGNQSATATYTITYKPKTVVDPNGTTNGTGNNGTNTNGTNTTGNDVIRENPQPQITNVAPTGGTETVTSSTYM